MCVGKERCKEGAGGSTIASRHRGLWAGRFHKGAECVKTICGDDLVGLLDISGSCGLVGG